MYLWWRTWHDDRRRLWAERFTSGDPKEALQRHADDLRFGWAAALDGAGVSSLEFTDEGGKVKVVADGTERMSDTDRAYYASGADLVSTQAKAEAQPAEPGSNPGSSTDDDELPF